MCQTPSKAYEKTVCDAKTYMELYTSALRNLVHQCGELEFGAIICMEPGLVYWEEGSDVLVESFVDNPLLQFTDYAEE